MVQTACRERCPNRSRRSSGNRACSLSCERASYFSVIDQLPATDWRWAKSFSGCLITSLGDFYCEQEQEKKRFHLNQKTFLVKQVINAKGFLTNGKMGEVLVEIHSVSHISNSAGRCKVPCGVEHQTLQVFAIKIAQTQKKSFLVLSEFEWVSIFLPEPWGNIATLSVGEVPSVYCAKWWIIAPYHTILSYCIHIHNSTIPVVKNWVHTVKHSEFCHTFKFLLSKSTDTAISFGAEKRICNFDLGSQDLFRNWLDLLQEKSTNSC